jgi:hypothetical protein
LDCPIGQILTSATARISGFPLAKSPGKGLFLDVSMRFSSKPVSPPRLSRLLRSVRRSHDRDVAIVDVTGVGFQGTAIASLAYERLAARSRT